MFSGSSWHCFLGISGISVALCSRWCCEYWPLASDIQCMRESTYCTGCLNSVPSLLKDKLSVDLKFNVPATSPYNPHWIRPWCCVAIWKPVENRSRSNWRHLLLATRVLFIASVGDYTRTVIGSVTKWRKLVSAETWKIKASSVTVLWWLRVMKSNPLTTRAIRCTRGWSCRENCMLFSAAPRCLANNVTPSPIGQRSCRVLWWACLSVCVCVCVFVWPRSYLQNYTSDLYQISVHVTYYGRGSVLFWRRSDTLRISGFVDDVIFTHQLVGCSTSPPGWGSEAHKYAALGLSRRNTRCRQPTLLQSGPTKLQWTCWIFMPSMLAHNVRAHIATRKWRVLKATLKVATRVGGSGLWLPCWSLAAERIEMPFRTRFVGPRCILLGGTV